jgi:amino acid permease
MIPLFNFGWMETQPELVKRVILTSAATVFLVTPASLTKKIGSLQIISFISLLAVLAFILSVMVAYFTEYTQDYQAGEVKLAVVDVRIFGVLGIITFAFACHTNLLPISAELKNTSK